MPGLYLRYSLGQQTVLRGSFSNTVARKRFGNAALTYEKYGFFLRIAANFREPRLREDEPIGADANTDRWIFAEGLNLTDEPFRVYFGKNSHRFAQFEQYGWSTNFGVHWKY